MDETTSHDLAAVGKALVIAVVFVVVTVICLSVAAAKPAPKQPKPLEVVPAAVQLPPATTTPTTTPAPAPAAWSAEVDQATPAPAAAPAAPGCFAELAAQVGWPADALPHLVAIIERESHCDPASSTGYRPSTGDWSLGLLQINTLGSLLQAREQLCGITAREQLLDPATNLRCGLALYKASGFAPWGG